MRGYDAKALESLMGISPKLAEINAKRFSILGADLSIGDASCRRAAFCFDGEACSAIHPESLDEHCLLRMNRGIRFISGYYGLLRPSDLMRAYRLEMGARPNGIGAKSLYVFWRGDIANLLEMDANDIGAESCLSLASEEYDKSARAQWTSKIPLHRSRFESDTSSGRQVVSFIAKKARGLFARHLALSDHETMASAAESFRLDGWRLDKASAMGLSGAKEWCFVQPKP